MADKAVVIRLTPKQADLVWRNVDGWMDAGSCEGGLEPDEREALECLEDQILRQIRKCKAGEQRRARARD